MIVVLPLVSGALVLWNIARGSTSHAIVPATEASPAAPTLAQDGAVPAPRLRIELDRPAPAPQPPDAYATWRSWCEGPADPCTKDSDCDADRTGRKRRCVRPYWSKTEKVCSIPHARRGELELRKAEARMVVDAQCGRRCDEERLWAFVALVAGRESTWRTWKHHRLNPDVRASATSWARAKAKVAGNKHYAEQHRWQGWGLLGQQSGTFSWRWDPAAPPEILCRAPVAISTYLSCARSSFTKQRSLGITPTWESIHWACSGGQVRPPGPSEDFRRRAVSVGLDPTEPIQRVEWLGADMGSDPASRNAKLATLEAKLVAARSVGGDLEPYVRCAQVSGPARWRSCLAKM